MSSLIMMGLGELLQGDNVETFHGTSLQGIGTLTTILPIFSNSHLGDSISSSLPAVLS